MIFSQLSGNLVQGIVLGAVYGMTTMGLSLIFGVLGIHLKRDSLSSIR